MSSGDWLNGYLMGSTDSSDMAGTLGFLQFVIAAAIITNVSDFIAKGEGFIFGAAIVVFLIYIIRFRIMAKIVLIPIVLMDGFLAYMFTDKMSFIAQGITVVLALLIGTALSKYIYNEFAVY